MSPYLIGVVLPFLFSFVLRNKNKNNGKKRGLPVEVGGEPGYAIRNRRFTSPVETAWEGVSTLAQLFEDSCNKNRANKLLGTRELIEREVQKSEDGRSFEKLHLGLYEWLSYGQAFEIVNNLSSGLVKLGHQKGERVAIFADTRAEWFLALQVNIAFVIPFSLPSNKIFNSLTVFILDYSYCCLQTNRVALGRTLLL